MKSIVKNDKLIEINLKNIEQVQFIDIYQDLLKNNIIVESFENKNEQIQFRVEKAEINKVLELLEKNYPNSVITQRNIVKLSIVGYGITQDNTILNKVIENLKTHNIDIKDINLSQSKMEVIVTDIDNSILEELHKELIKN